MTRRSEVDPLSAAIGARIRMFRDEAGLTLEKLAYETDQSKGHLSDIERGYSRPSIATLNRIAEHLGVLLLDLVTFPEDDARQEVTDRLRGLSDKDLRQLRRELAIDD